MPDCPPCKTLDQIILELAPEFENDVNFLQLDATLPSNEPIVFQFKILNVPQILFFKNGNKVDHTLFTNKEKLAKMIEKWK
jgi:thiol-disulfide isomerase/thioredoxin